VHSIQAHRPKKIVAKEKVAPSSFKYSTIHGDKKKGKKKKEKEKKEKTCAHQRTN